MNNEVHAIEVKDSLISEQTINAYIESSFEMFSPINITIRIQEKSEELKSIFKLHSVSSAAFITAYNPYSNQLSHTENVKRHAKFQHILEFSSLKFFPGIGQHPSNKWPIEEGFLILGISLEAAKKLGVQFEQNAIIWCGESVVPNLVLLR